ncbi:hypothetical protein FOL47_007800 [Perkinsus chesapeaki]|uniref:Thioredoxin domain-containing protein n=1 Tax=Perkinsus chesapeaki TaxID=330153 RepID=A0A7J6LI78_PERCH|nr:hypothetical protein FOL47_007800 [Perkinsus chesapeaki]
MRPPRIEPGTFGLPQAWLPASPGSQMRVRELEEERERLLSTVHELEGKCHHYLSRLSEIERVNIDLERKLSDTIMDNSERIRVEHADHRRLVEEREHQIGVLRHECETERSVRSREVTSLKASLENERRLLMEARAREEDTMNECRMKISELEADFSSREKILIDQRDEMERSLRVAIKRLENEVEKRVEDLRGREMVWEKVKGDIEGKLVELTAENARFRQEAKELRGELSETQERLRKTQRHAQHSPSLPASPSSFRPALPPPPWATHEGIPLTSAEHGSGIDSRKSWYASPKRLACFSPKRDSTAAGKPTLSRRLANYMDEGIVGCTDRIIVRDSSRIRNLSPSLSLSEQCRQLEQQLMHCNAEKNALENALNKYPTNSAGRTLNERIDKREKEQRLASVELAISNIKAKLRDLDALLDELVAFSSAHEHDSDERILAECRAVARQRAPKIFGERVKVDGYSAKRRPVSIRRRNLSRGISPLRSYAGGLPSSKLRILTDESFEHDTQASTGSTTGPWFVMFYAPWCGHCQKLLPTWEDLADEMFGQVNVAAVDVTANTEIGSRFTIKRLPTLYLINHGKMYRYGGPRTLEALMEFASSPEVYTVKAAESQDVPKPPSGLKRAMAQFEKLIQSKFVRDHPIIVAVGFSVSVFIMMAITAYSIFLCTNVSESDAKAEVQRRLNEEEKRAAEQQKTVEETETKKEK